MEPGDNPSVDETSDTADQPQTLAAVPQVNYRWGGLGLAACFQGGLALLAVLFGWLIGSPAWQTFRWNFKDVWIGGIAALPLFAFFVYFSHAPLQSFQRIREILDLILMSLFGRSSALELAVVAALAGISEEMMFRAVIQGWLDPHLGTFAACLAASLLFGAAHMVTVTYFVVASAIGCYLGWLWALTGNLLAPIVAHAVYDFLALYYYLRIHTRRLGQCRDVGPRSIVGLP